MTSTSVAVQASLEDCGVPLREVTFCIVDLETTGGGRDDAITEIGAVKVRGGVVEGEFQTLINPVRHIPAMIAVLTGITDAMVAAAPRLDQALPAFLEFASGTVLVAHNARFDVGFLRRGCAELDLTWPEPTVVDTMVVARQALLRDEVANCKLSTLAAHFHAGTDPDHRALSDARATTDVLHSLLERLGSLGVDTLEDLGEFAHRVSPQRRAKRGWAAGLPERAGVYWFWGPPGSRPGGAGQVDREVLYVGKSTNLRRRVASYFTASERRGRMEEMIRVATGVEVIVCETALEAEVRELRLIHAHAPRYNRRSRRQDKIIWVKITKERYPRLSIVTRRIADGCLYWGPFSRRAEAEQACLALYEAFPIRQCGASLSRQSGQGCVLADLQRCLAPCRGRDRDEQYSMVVSQLRTAIRLDIRPTVERLGARIGALAGQQRFEEAAALLARLDAYTAATLRWNRVTSVSDCAQLVAAAPAEGGWEIHLIRHGRLAGAAFADAGRHPLAVAEELIGRGETVLPEASGAPSASIEEVERICAWLESPGVRLIGIDGEWSWPIHAGMSRTELACLARPAGGPPTGWPGARPPGGGCPLPLSCPTELDA